MFTQHHSARCVFTVLGAVLGLAGSAQAASTPAPPPEHYVVKDKGKGWQLLEVEKPGQAAGPGVELWMVAKEGIENLPVSDFEKNELAGDFEPDDPQATVIFAERAMSASIESGTIPPGYEVYAESESDASLSCSGWSATKYKDWDYNFSESTLDRDFNLPAGLQGTFAVNLPLSGSAHLKFGYKIKKNFLCIPYKFKFVSAHLYGNLTVGGDADLTASFSVSGQWSKEWKLFDPEVADFTFMAGPVPVRIEITLPTFAGMGLEASLSGSVGANTDLSSSGTFDYTCTPDDCQGSNTLGDVFDAGEVTGSAQLDAKASAHARVMARVALYDDAVAYVEAGIKGMIEADLWGYYGNTCGDADGLNGNETVRALVADLNWGYDIVYGIGGWLLPDPTWTRTGDRYPLGWRDLLGQGGSTALQPMLQGPLEVVKDQAASYTVKMRPCYPYPERVNFTIQPGTWNGNTFIPEPKSTTASQNSSVVSRSFNTTGSKTLVVTNMTDGNGRNIRVPYSRTIQVVPAGCGDTTPPAVTLTAPAEGVRLWGNATLTANASDNVGVTRVDFQINGATVCSDTAAPWSCVASVDSHATGDYAFRAVARDACDNTRTSTSVTARIVSNPELWLDLPSPNASVSGTSVAVQGWATDPNGVASVALSLDNQFTLPVSYGAARGDVCQAVPVADPHCPNVGLNASLNSTLYANGTHTLRLTAIDATGKSSTFVRSFVIANPLAPCVPGPTTLCLRNDRFKVQVSYVNGGGGGPAQARPYSDQSGFFSFFDSANLEVGVKVLGPANGYYWLYDGAATDREYTLSVTDTQTGALKTYVKPAGSFCGHGDTQAFAAGTPLASSEPEPAEALAFDIEPEPGRRDEDGSGASASACTPSSTALCLLNDRFRVELLRNGVPQAGVELTPLSGTFLFFGAANAEVLVKVLDGHPINGHFWVYYGGLTDLEYRVRVTDTQSGSSVEYANPQGSICGAGHVDSF